MMSVRNIPLKMVAIIGRLLVRMGLAEQLTWFISRLGMSHYAKAKAFAGYVPRPGDVFVATYSKSGTYWMMQTALQIAHLGQAEFDHIHDLIPWPDTPILHLKAGLFDHSLAETSPTGLRIVKTHWEPEYVPYHPAAKYIVVVRDPKDVVVSGYFFAHDIIRNLGLSLTTEQWLNMFLGERYFFGSWAEHTAGWWPLREANNVLILDYRRLKECPDWGIEQVRSLLDVDLTAEQREQVIEKSSFAYMKKHQHRFSPNIPWAGQPNLIRQGKTNSGKELYNVDQLCQIDNHCQKELKRLGSDFPYEQFFQ